MFIRAHGGIDRIEVGELPTPVAGQGEVVVKMHACALNHLDIWVREGIPGLKLAYPHVLGSDGSGVVDHVGSGVAGIKPGDEVILYPGLSCGKCAECREGIESLCRSYQILGEQVSGTLSEFVKVPTANCFLKPGRLSFEEAAALPLVFTTAWEMVVNKARVKAGDRVLIHAAGSGVSSAAIQIARVLGAEVFVTSSTEEKLCRAAELGARHLINSRTQDFTVEIRKLVRAGVDVIIDHVGSATWQGNIRCLRSGGTLVLCGATTGAEGVTDLKHLFFRQLRLLGSTMGSKRDFPRILSHVEAGEFGAVVAKVFEFAEVREAFRYLEARQQFGKVVVRAS